MSKDKGSKNIKKAPADKSAGLGKKQSDYKSETKSGYGKPASDTLIPKKDGKSKP
jgi:hypothetical protein